MPEISSHQSIPSYTLRFHTHPQTASPKGDSQPSAGFSHLPLGSYLFVEVVGWIAMEKVRTTMLDHREVSPFWNCCWSRPNAAARLYNHSYPEGPGKTKEEQSWSPWPNMDNVGSHDPSPWLMSSIVANETEFLHSYHMAHNIHLCIPIQTSGTKYVYLHLPLYL